MATRTASSLTAAGTMFAAALVALVFAMGGSASADEAAISFSPDSFDTGATVTLRYFGVSAGATIDLVHEERGIAGVPRRVAVRIGMTVGKSGSLTFTAPSPLFTYRAEIRDDCGRTLHIGDCELFASAGVPLSAVSLTGPEHAFPGDTVTVRWAHAPAHAELYWSYLLFGTPVILERALSIDAAAGSVGLRVPRAGPYGRGVTLGPYDNCITYGIGPFSRTSCDGLYASLPLTGWPAEISVQPVAYPGDGVFVTYEHAPVNASLYLDSGATGLFAPGPMYVGSIEGPGDDIDEDVTASGSVGFWAPTDFSVARIELRNRCDIVCRFAPWMLRIYDSAPFAVAHPEFDVTPNEVHEGDSVRITYAHAPADAVVAKGLSPLGFGSRFASGPSGTRVTVDLAPGTHILSLHARCEFSNVWGYEMASCSPTLATATLTVMSDEPVGRSPTPGPVVARPTFAVPTAATAVPGAITGLATDAPSVVPPSPPATDPLASPHPTVTPEPTIVVVIAGPARTTAPTPAPTPIIVSAPPAQTTLPTYAPTPTATHIPIVVPTPTPTVVPTKTPTPTQQPTATPTQKPNSSPQIAKIGDQSGKAGQAFVIGVSATDPDGDKITLGCGGADKFIDYGNGTGSFQWTGTKAGKYSFTCTASDGKLSSSTSFTITVN